MRHALVAFIILTLAANFASAQNPAWAQKLFGGVTQHDFGTVPRGAQLKHRFPIKNIYAVPLHITEVRSTCGCLTATPSKQVLQPQEEAYLDILMDGRRFTGPKTITVFVSVGPQYVSTATLVITANARADVVFNPGEINFGVVRQGQTPTRTIDVEYAGNLDWRITEVVKNSAAPFTVVPRELYRVKPGLLQSGKVGYQMAVTLKADAPAGPFRQELLLKTNDTVSQVLTVVVEGVIQGNLTVAPDQIRVAQKVGELSTRKVVLRGSRPFHITGVDGQGDGISVELPPGQAVQHFVTVKIQGQSRGDIRKELRIRTDLEGNETVTIVVQASISN